MMLFRSAKSSDLDAIHRLAEESGIGMTTLPKDKDLLDKRLKWAQRSFKKNVQQPNKEYYLFIMEEVQTGKIVGTSAVEARIGHELPFYSYKLSKRTRICHSLNIRSDYEVLSLVNDNQGKSEICTLFLTPDFRHSGNGLLLSRARFLFMAHYPQRFAPTVIAEMRGVSDEKGHSPFWDNVGCHFFQMPFEQADCLTLSTNKQFIADLMPRNPIYVKLLSEKAQSVIGQPHPSTAPALNILLREGFRHTNYVDIFDVGPTIEAPLKDIKTISASRLMVIKNTIDEVSSKRYILSNTRMDFRATIGHVVFNDHQKSCMISKENAELLQVKAGDSLRISPLYIDDSNQFK